MTDNSLQAIEQNIQQSKATVELGVALTRLIHNRDFKLVVQKGFFENEAIRLVHLKSDPNHQSSDAQESILKKMDAIGTFNQYLKDLILQSEVATKSLEISEEARDDMLKEGNE